MREGGAGAGEASPPLSRGAETRCQQQVTSQLYHGHAPRGLPPAPPRPATWTLALRQGFRSRRPMPLPCALGPPSPRTPRCARKQVASVGCDARCEVRQPPLRLTSHWVSASRRSMVLCGRTWPQNAADTTTSQGGKPGTMLPMRPGRTAVLLAEGELPKIDEVGRDVGQTPSPPQNTVNPASDCDSRLVYDSRC